MDVEIRNNNIAERFLNMKKALFIGLVVIGLGMFFCGCAAQEDYKVDTVTVSP